MKLNAALVSVSLTLPVLFSSCDIFIAGESCTQGGPPRYALSTNSVTNVADVTVTYLRSLCDVSSEFSAAKKTLLISLDGRKVADVVLGNGLVNESFSGIWHVDAAQINSFKGRKEYRVSVEIEISPPSRYLQSTVQAKEVKDERIVIDSQ